MRRIVTLAALIALVAPAAATPGNAEPLVKELTPGQKLDRARASVRTKDWATAQAWLEDLLTPQVELARRSDVVEVHTLLGTAYLMQGKRADAVREYENALELDPERSITDYFHPEIAVRLFEDTKARIKDRLAAEAKQRELLERERRLREYIDTIGVYETHLFWLNIVPFGAGQFQNKHTTKGWLLAATEGATLVTSLGCWLYLGGKYGVRGGKVPLAEAASARRIQQIEVGTGIAFLALYLYGVIDGIRHYEPTIRVQGDESIRDLIDRDQLGTPPRKRSKPTSLRDRLRLSPLLSPTGVGLGLSLEID